jgi:hypothetical protein
MVKKRIPFYNHSSVHSALDQTENQMKAELLYLTLVTSFTGVLWVGCAS